MREDDMLFAPLRINGLEVRGRVFKTATTETLATEDGFIGDDYLRFYEPLAWAGTPLIITGNMYVGRSGKPTYRSPGIDADDKLHGLRRLTELVHRHGARIVVQVNHVGRQCNPKAVGNREAIAPSAVREPTTFTKPREMSADDIARTVDEFASAAQRAEQAGFDGVQIHMSHGYLLCEFLTPHTNRRTDAYGGSFENRLRLPREVVRAARARISSGFPLLIKLNGADLLMRKGGLDTDELIRIAQALVAEGVDAIEVSCSHYESGFPMLRGRFDGFVATQMRHGQGLFLPAWRRHLMAMFDKPLAKFANRRWPAQQGFNLDFARRFKAALSAPVISVGGFYEARAMREAIAGGAADAVSIARAMVADPFLYRHLRDGTAGPRCDYCNQCVARGGREGLRCVNPHLQESRAAMLRAAGF